MNVHSSVLLLLIISYSQARREPQRGPGKHYRGALSPSPILYVLRSRDDTWGEVSPHHPTKGSGERRKLHQRGPGRPKIDFMHILGQTEAICNTVFSIFERRRGPQTSRGPGKLFPLPPSRQAWLQSRTFIPTSAPGNNLPRTRTSPTNLRFRV